MSQLDMTAGTLATPTGQPTDETRLTYKAGAAYLANELYTQALKEDNPAKTLDNIADDLPTVMPEVFKTLGTAPDLAAALLPEIKNLVWAYTAIEYARREAGDGYGYLFDYLAEGLSKGADPHIIRRDALAAPGRIRASRITARIWEARDEAEGPWAGILDILLAEIDKGADPQAVVDQAADLMHQARTGQATA
jgi:hypothetical protein